MTNEPELTVIPYVSEFSRSISLTSVRDRRRYTDSITANSVELKALAKRYHILAVNDLQADVTLEPLGADLIQLRTVIKAEVVQACGMSMVPVTQQIDETEAEILTTSAEMLTPLEDGPPDDSAPTELITGDVIDYGEIVAQIVALAIDPFPRSETANDTSHIEHNTNPFAVLQTLQPKPKK